MQILILIMKEKSRNKGNIGFSLYMQQKCNHKNFQPVVNFNTRQNKIRKNKGKKDYWYKETLQYNLSVPDP